MRSDGFYELRIKLGIGIATADHTADALSFEAIGLREDSSQSESAGRFGLQVRESEQQSHRLLDLVFSDLDDSRQTRPEDFPVAIAEAKHASAIGNSAGFLRDRDNVPGAKRLRSIVG